MVKQTLPTPNNKDNQAGRKHLNDIMKTRFMFGRAHIFWHKALKEYLENSFTVGDKKYPSNTAALLSMLNNFWTSDVQLYWTANQNTQGEDDGLNFAQDGGAPPAESTTGINMVQDTVPSNGPCGHCRRGHWIGNCNGLSKEELGDILIQLGEHPTDIEKTQFGN